MPRSSPAFRAALAFVLLGIFFFDGCHSASPGEKSLQTYKQNVPKFQAMLPQWSKSVSDEDEKNVLERPVGPFKG